MTHITKNIASLLPITLVNLGMGYHFIQPHMFSERSSQILLLTASLITLWIILPRLIYTTQTLEKMSYISLFVLIHLSYVYMNPMFIRVVSLFMFVNSVYFFIITAFPIQTKRSQA